MIVNLFLFLVYYHAQQLQQSRRCAQLPSARKKTGRRFLDSLLCFLCLTRQFFNDIAGNPNPAGARLRQAARNAGAVAADIQTGDFCFKPVV